MTRCVLEWLERAAKIAPEVPACDNMETALTWRQMLLRARSIGVFVAEHVQSQTPVLILMEKSPACLAAMLGTVYAGCFYTPIDASMPEARMRVIADVLQPGLILCDPKYMSLAMRLAGDALVAVAAEIADTQDEQMLLPRRAGHVDTDLLYVLFTSGSTGVPKGVAVTHRSVIDFVEWACEALRLPAGCRFGSQAPFYFDNSVLDIYCTMHCAGSLCILPRAHFMFPKKLLESLAAQRIDTIFWVPSALTAVANAGALAACPLPDLRRVFFCGEVMPCRTLNAWRRALPQADYVNMYGPTEITDVCAWYRIDRDFADDDVLPIGFPCQNTRILLLEGEICVSGTCLAAGYYNAPEKTAKAFVQNPLRPQIPELIYKTGDLGIYNERGELMFLGRRDGQIKRSGYRIELGEIECALNASEGVEAGCCFFDGEREKIVCAWIGAEEEKALRSSLRNRLPKYMLPDVWLHLEKMPQTGSGKIDRVRVRYMYEHPVV